MHRFCFCIPLANKKELIRLDGGWSIAPGVAQTHDSIIEAYVANLAHPPSFFYLLEAFTVDEVTLEHFYHDDQQATRTAVLRIIDSQDHWFDEMENMKREEVELSVRREVKAMTLLLAPCIHKDDLYVMMSRGAMNLLLRLHEHEPESVAPVST